VTAGRGGAAERRAVVDPEEMCLCHVLSYIKTVSVYMIVFAITVAVVVVMVVV
jgi:hypothetical protein